MPYTNLQLSFFFFTYSFLGWLLETVAVTLRGRHFANRGFIALPFCPIYGLAGVLLATTMVELKERPVFLFLGCALIATALEWGCAKFLEWVGARKWWDYSGRRWNLDGYICLSYSLLWGGLGAVSVFWGNGALCTLLDLVPPVLSKVLLCILITLTVLDSIFTLTAVVHKGNQPQWMDQAGKHMRGLTLRLGQRVSRHVERLERAYPGKSVQAQPPEAQGKLTFGKLLWVFALGSLLGDLVETLFCFATTGVWMSRSSLVWGPFSVVWGGAMILATALLHRYQNRPSSLIFWVGTLLGGAYEYVCSVLGELVFGAVFWDYSDYPFNLGGRINLLYCFFWGFAAVAWIKGAYPWFSQLIDRLRAKTGPWATRALALFLAVNCLVSVAALMRYDARADGIAPANGVELLLDARFDDQRMGRIYPNLVHTNEN